MPPKTGRGILWETNLKRVTNRRFNDLTIGVFVERHLKRYLFLEPDRGKPDQREASCTKHSVCKAMLASEDQGAKSASKAVAADTREWQYSAARR